MDMENKLDIIDELIEKEYWVVDILPEQVPENSPGQYFEVEKYYLQYPHVDRIFSKFTDILLKLNCYFDFSVSLSGGDWEKNPKPDALAEMMYDYTAGGYMAGKYIYIFIEAEGTLISLMGDSLYMTFYDPSERVLRLTEALARSEGLFLWQPPQK